MNVPVFLGVTVVLMGFAAWMTGQAMANAWKPFALVAVYVALLGLGDRFLTFALFDGELLSVTGYLLDTAVLLAIAAVSYRLTLAARMTSQYPWLYRRAGPFAWRARDGGEDGARDDDFAAAPRERGAGRRDQGVADGPPTQ